MNQVTIPVMDQTTETVTLAHWHVQEGDAVRRGDVVCEIETEKATVEIQAPADGILRKVLVERGAQVPPRAVVALIGNADELLPELDPLYQTARARDAGTTQGVTTESLEKRTTQVVTTEPLGGTTQVVTTKRMIASPRAKKLAADKGIDLATVTGSGPGGRILEEDVERAIREQGGSQAQRLAHAKAERVSRSWQTIPHFYMTVTADLSRIAAARAHAQFDVTFTDYFVAALAQVLPNHPDLNGYWENGAPALEPELRIGVVVQTERGLLIPALRDVRGRKLEDIAAERAQIVAQARLGKLSGGAQAQPTFTLSNVGAGHIDAFTAIISPPQLAILSVGSVMPRPVVVGQKLEVRPIASFTLGADHRAVDGRQAAAFLEELKQKLEGAV